MKKHFFFPAIAVVMGLLLSLQVRSFQREAFLIRRSEAADVLKELRIFQLANERLRTRIEEQDGELAQLRSKLAAAAVEEEIERLKLLSGETAISGEGIEISISVPVEEFWITDLIAQLVSSGAEAIAVNDIRFTAQTAGFRSVGGGLLMRRHFLTAPLKITAIGPHKELKDSVAQTGGILDRMQGSYKNAVVSLAGRGKIFMTGL